MGYNPVACVFIWVGVAVEQPWEKFVAATDIPEMVAEELEGGDDMVIDGTVLLRTFTQTDDDGEEKIIGIGSPVVWMGGPCGAVSIRLAELETSAIKLTEELRPILRDWKVPGIVKTHIHTDYS